jgi:hypothetical protein
LYRLTIIPVFALISGCPKSNANFHPGLLGSSFTSGGEVVNGQLNAAFQLVPEPVAATVLMTMLAGLAGIAGVLKKKRS